MGIEESAMNQIECRATAGPRAQKGTTLIVALVLLLLATLLGLFAMNVGIFAQRTSGADMRARVIHQTLEAGIAQGVEYIRNNRTTVLAAMLSNPCTAVDTTFPCGTVPRCATTNGASSISDSAGNTSDGDTACTGDLQRRGHMYRYFNSAGPGYDVNGNGGSPDNLDKASLPLGASLMTSAGNGFTVNYGVGAVMCMVKKPATATDPTECTTNNNLAQGTYLFTVTAVGSIQGEAASTTLTTTFGTSPTAPGAGNAPTVTASGSIDLNGNGTFVTNPNAAGNGLPVTVWSPQCVNTQGAGTVNTCYAEDWLRASAGTYTYAANSDGSASSIPVCSGNGNKACSCSNSISAGSGNLLEGIDVLTNDTKGSCTGAATQIAGTAGCTNVATCKANYNVDETEFPCDLFRYIFNVQAWDDKVVQSPGTANASCTEGGASGGGDCFCEYHKPTTYTVADGSSQTMGFDEAFLYQKANYIYSTANPGWVSTLKKATSCADLITKGSASGGLIWDQTGTCFKTATQVGYPDKPVIIVSDGTADLQGAVLYGMLFVRDTTAAGSSTTYGGAANFVGHSTGTIYGAVVVQGHASKINGSSAVIYNQTVMSTLLNLTPMNPAAPVPGSWTDRYAY
jgi:Tfp pilus assembly protein PilX